MEAVTDLANTLFLWILGAGLVAFAVVFLFKFSVDAISTLLATGVSEKTRRSFTRRR